MSKKRERGWLMPSLLETSVVVGIGAAGLWTLLEKPQPRQDNEIKVIAVIPVDGKDYKIVSDRKYLSDISIARENILESKTTNWDDVRKEFELDAQVQEVPRFQVTGGKDDDNWGTPEEQRAGVKRAKQERESAAASAYYFNLCRKVEEIYLSTQEGTAFDKCLLEGRNDAILAFVPKEPESLHNEIAGKLRNLDKLAENPESADKTAWQLGFSHAGSHTQENIDIMKKIVDKGRLDEDDIEAKRNIKEIILPAYMKARIFGAPTREAGLGL